MNARNLVLSPMIQTHNELLTPAPWPGIDINRLELVEEDNVEAVSFLV